MNKIISKFKEKPKTKAARRALWLGLSAMFIFHIVDVIMHIIRWILDPTNTHPTPVWGIIAIASVVFSLVLSVSALVVGIRAFKRGERSWMLWLGFVSAILNGAFWIFMIIGEFLFPH